jgi:hypothetical protein
MKIANQFQSTECDVEDERLKIEEVELKFILAFPGKVRQVSMSQKDNSFSARYFKLMYILSRC